MSWSIAFKASLRLSQTNTPLPAASPSAFKTMPSGRERTYSVASAAVLKAWRLPRSSTSTCTPGSSISRGSMIRLMASIASAAVRHIEVPR